MKKSKCTFWGKQIPQLAVKNEKKLVYAGEPVFSIFCIFCPVFSMALFGKFAQYCSMLFAV